MTNRNDGAAIYARYSTSKQTSDSIEDQLRVCREFAERSGMTIVATYIDEAESGAHVDRKGFNDLREAALLPARLRKFDKVIVADLSRLARDLWVMGRAVFEEFLPAGVVLFDRTTGLSSDAPAARTTFAAVGIANDAFLQSVREKTHTALEGRARHGFSTGGFCYGYRNETAEAVGNRNPRVNMVIHEEQAAIVRRIFTSYVEGHGTKSIADMLNREGVHAPYDGRKHKTNGDGWAHTSVRAMLLNERYIGRFVWNKRRFVRVAGKKNRRAKTRPPSEWVVVERPELAIVGKELWEAATARRAKHHSGGGGRGRPLGAGKNGPQLLSGILVCGVCGNAMGTVSGGKYGCLRSDSRGYSSTAGCKNRLSISSRAVEDAVLGEIRKLFDDSGQWAPMVSEVMRALHVSAVTPPPEKARLDDELKAVQSRITRLTEAVADRGASQALLDKLDAEEARARTLKEALRGSRPPTSRILPTTMGEVKAVLERLGTIDREDRTIANATLKAYLGRVVMTPQDKGPERGYRASGAIDLFVPLPRGGEKVSCGGRI